MANASKALIMAGGVLITMLIISISLFVLTNARGVADASEKRITVNQIEAFNRFFTNYPSEIRGIDVYNIIGKIEDMEDDEDPSIDPPNYVGAVKSDVTSTKDMANKRYGYICSDSNDDGIIDSIVFQPHADVDTLIDEEPGG